MHLLRRKCPALRSALLVWLVAGLLASCSLLTSQKSNEQALRTAADRFNTALRWEDYKAAASRIAPSGREVFWDQVDQLQGLVRIVDCQVVDVKMYGDGGSGTVTLRYRFFWKRYSELQTTMMHQKWVFSEREGTWLVVKNDLERLIP